VNVIKEVPPLLSLMALPTANAAVFDAVLVGLFADIGHCIECAGHMEPLLVGLAGGLRNMEVPRRNRQKATPKDTQTKQSSLTL
jgi:hypothetical protein